MSGSRRSHHRHTLIVTAAVTLLASCDAAPDPAGDQEVLPGQALSLKTVVDNYAINTVRGNKRTPVAAVVDLGPTHYSVAHVNPFDELVYSHYSVNIGPQVGIFATQQQARWIRANASPGFSRPCGPSGGHTTEYVNFIVAQTDTSVRLDRLSVCGENWAGIDSRVIDTGYRPSFATRGTLTAGRGLLVYGKDNRLLGRFIGFSEFGTSVGDAFTITTVSNTTGFYSTDVIFNQHSGRYIVGFIERGMGVCNVNNVMVTDGAPPVVDSWKTFGGCDSDNGGHATSVAYSPAGDGRYVWWRQNPLQHKFVFQHASMGGLLPPSHQTNADNSVQPGTAWTVPVAASQRADVPYMFMQANRVWGLKDGAASPIASDTGDDSDVAVSLRSVGGMTVGLKIRGGDPNSGLLTLSLWGP